MAGENAADVLSRLGDRWKGVIERAADLDAGRDEGRVRAMARVGIREPLGPNYGEAERLRKQLLKEYKGKRIEDVFRGREVNLGDYACYQIQSDGVLDLDMIKPTTAKERLVSNLKLLYGIGDVTEQRLKDQGYLTIPDLTDHPQHGAEAQRFLNIMADGNVVSLMQWIKRWLSSSHPLSFHCSSFHDIKNLVLLDIETMGLTGDRPLFLCGVAQISGTSITVNQYLVREVKEEVAVLMMFLTHVNDDSFLVTFNGKSFDVPYVQARMAYYGLRGRLDLPHYDMLHFARNAWREKVPDCRLTTLEGYLFHTARENDVPSELVPDFYQTYLETGNVGPLVPVIEHNKQDVITLAHVFARLHEEWK